MYIILVLYFISFNNRNAVIYNKFNINKNNYTIDFENCIPTNGR